MSSAGTLASGMKSSTVSSTVNSWPSPFAAQERIGPNLQKVLVDRVAATLAFYPDMFEPVVRAGGMQARAGSHLM